LPHLLYNNDGNSAICGEINICNIILLGFHKYSAKRLLTFLLDYH
jgi:hypothetical protein